MGSEIDHPLCTVRAHRLERREGENADREADEAARGGARRHLRGRDRGTTLRCVHLEDGITHAPRHEPPQHHHARYARAERGDEEVGRTNEEDFTGQADDDEDMDDIDEIEDEDEDLEA